MQMHLNVDDLKHRNKPNVIIPTFKVASKVTNTNFYLCWFDCRADFCFKIHTSAAFSLLGAFLTQKGLEEFLFAKFATFVRWSLRWHHSLYYYELAQINSTKRHYISWAASWASADENLCNIIHCAAGAQQVTQCPGHDKSVFICAAPCWIGCSWGWYTFLRANHQISQYMKYVIHTTLACLSI